MARKVLCSRPANGCAAPAAAAKLEVRVESLETNLQALANDVAVLTQTVSDLSKTTAAMTQGISDLRDSVREQNDALQKMISSYFHSAKGEARAQRREVLDVVKQTRGEHGTQIGDLYNRLTELSKTNWSTVIAGVSAVVAILSLIGGVAVSPLYVGQAYLQKASEARDLELEKRTELVRTDLTMKVAQMEDDLHRQGRETAELRGRVLGLEQEWWYGWGWRGGPRERVRTGD